MPPTRIAMNEDIKNYIDQRDTVVEQKIKLWILSSVVAQVLALTILLGPMIFYLGGIYQNMNASLVILNGQQQELAVRSKWMQDVDARQRELRLWAKTKGFVPFTPEIPVTPIK